MLIISQARRCGAVLADGPQRECQAEFVNQSGDLALAVLSNTLNVPYSALKNGPTVSNGVDSSPP